MISKGKVCSCFGAANAPFTAAAIDMAIGTLDREIAEGVRTFLFYERKSGLSDLVYNHVSEARLADPSLGLLRVYCFPTEVDIGKPPRSWGGREYDGYDGFARPATVPETDMRQEFAMIDRSDVVLLFGVGDERIRLARRYAIKNGKKVVDLSADDIQVK